jgi:hypothetical protein
VAAKEIAVKKYVVRLSVDERAQLDDLIHKGKRSAQLLTKARILLKADVSEAGEGWSDSRIAEALDTSVANILRTRRQLVEEGFEAVLTRKYNPNSARPRICREIDPVVAIYLRSAGIYCGFGAPTGLKIETNLNRHAVFAAWTGNKTFSRFLDGLCKCAVLKSASPPLYEIVVTQVERACAEARRMAN